jgi:hypothetical protein
MRFWNEREKLLTRRNVYKFIPYQLQGCFFVLQKSFHFSLTRQRVLFFSLTSQSLHENKNTKTQRGGAESECMKAESNFNPNADEISERKACFSFNRHSQIEITRQFPAFGSCFPAEFGTKLIKIAQHFELKFLR